MCMIDGLIFCERGICREVGKERRPDGECAAQRQEEAFGLWHRGEHQLPRQA